MGDESKHADWSREVKLSRRALLKAGAAAPLGAVLASLAARHAAAEPRRWTYEGDTGPEQWGGLDPGYEACRLGSMQSPVDIPGDAPVVSEDVAYSYRDSTLAILDNGHTIQVDYDPGSAIVIDGVMYALKQFHFHSPSEHTLDRRHADMEMHLVHADPDGHYAVIGVLLVEGSANPALDAVWANLPSVEGEPVRVEGVTVNVDDLLPLERAYRGYVGSLTTPPCTEGVAWHVLVDPVELSADQIARYRAIHHGTNRPAQPLNGREFKAAG